MLFHFFSIYLQQNQKKYMFKNYDTYYTKYCNYLKKLEAVMNSTDTSDGFISREILMVNVYDKIMPLEFQVRRIKDVGRLVLCGSTNEDDEKYNTIKLETLTDCQKVSYSVSDTCNKIKYFTIFNGKVLIFTDYGLIEMTSYYREDGLVKKISDIRVWIDDESHKQEIENFIDDNVVTVRKNDEGLTKIGVCTQSNYGIRTTEVEIKKFECDLEKNYNNDLPYERMTDLIKSEKEELILLHGEPGTGKTSIIKKLINDNPDIDFIYFDFNLLTSFSDGKIFDFLSEHKNNVLIIEDCEKLFTDRNEGNRYLNSMLNLTDGIIGEAFAIKFICTFNCPVSKIDKAVLREGRLSLLYEFKKLSLEKTKALDPTATEPETLAEIYNKGDNGNNKKTKKIGF